MDLFEWYSYAPFEKIRIVVQESVVLSKCHTMHNMTFWPQMSYYQGFSKQCKMLFCIHDEDK